MKRLLFFIILYASSSFIKCNQEDEENRQSCVDEGEKCLPDKSGFGKCDWNNRVKNVICSKPNSLCKCYYDYEMWTTCECVNPRSPPSFPATGVIRWNGSMVYEDDDEDYTTTYYSMTGEVHKDSEGRFLKKWSKEEAHSLKKKFKFEIIIPNADGRGYTKYKGDDKSTKCRKSQVSYEGQLSSIWNKNERGRYYALQNETRLRGDIFRQQWKQFEQGEDYDITWIWIVKYSKKKGVAIPDKYYQRGNDRYYSDEYNYEYTFEDTGDDETFQLEDYCNDEV